MPMSRDYAIYCHTTPSGKRYIGQTRQSLNARWQNGRGYATNDYFTKAINKYGWDNIKHSVLCWCSSKDAANFLEQWFIKEYDTHNKKHGYNLTLGGDGGLGRVITDEYREKMRRIGKKRGISPELNKKMKEGRRKNGWRRRPMTEEEKKAVSERMSGENHPYYGKKMPREWVMKRAESVRGRKASAETRKNQSIGLRNSEKVKAKRKAVLQLDSNGEVIAKHKSIRHAAEAIGVSNSAISMVCRGVCNSAGGYGWKYEKEEFQKKAEAKVQKRNDTSTIGLPVIQFDLDGKEVARFNSTGDAEKKTGFPRIDITACCRGRRKTSHGYIWKYVTEESSVASIEYSSTS